MFWTHNDSGGGNYLYGFNRAGRSMGRWKVRDARSIDWEDLAIGPGRGGRSSLFIGDIGDNNHERKSIVVYQVAEPTPGKAGATKSTAEAKAFRLRYPDDPHDAECLMVHPRSGDVYIVTKAKLRDSATAVYCAKAPLKTKKVNLLRRVGELDLPDASPFTLVVGRITGGDISPDGKRVVVCDYFGAWEAVLPAGSTRFDAIWKAKWRQIAIGSRKQGEAICYRHDGEAILATSEGSPFPLIEARRVVH